MLRKLTNSKWSSGILWYSEVYSLVMTIKLWTQHPFPWTFQSCARCGDCEKVMWKDYRRDYIGYAAGDVQPIRKKEHMTNIDQQFKSQTKQWIWYI